MALKGASALVARSPTPPSSLPPHARTARATSPPIIFTPPQVSRQLAFFNAARSTRDPGFFAAQLCGWCRAPTLTPPTLSSTAACNGDIWTWKQYYADTIKCAKALMHLGLNRFESVSILGFNSPEWLIANNGAIAAGGFAAGIYTTNEPPACKYIVEHCSARVVVVEGQKQLDKILAIRAELPKLKAIVVYGGDFDKSANDGVGEGQAKVYGWKEFMDLGEKISDAQVEARIADQKPGHCCTLIYTSGTTGNPKAVMISHDNVTWTTKANMDHQPAITSGDLRVVSYLPLSHIAAQIVDIHSPMAGLLLGLKAEVHFARPRRAQGFPQADPH